MFDLLFRELRRKAFHFTGTLIPVIYYFIDKDTALIVLSFVDAILLLVEWLRLNGKIKIPELLLRPHEDKQVAAYIYFMTASLISILVFEKTIAIAAILMLSIGDTASGLAGAMIKGGNIRYHNTQNIEVKPPPIMAVTFSVCILLGLILLNLPLGPGMIPLSFRAYAAGAVGATLGDAVPVRIKGRSVDDNLIIPIVAGLCMTILSFI